MFTYYLVPHTLKVTCCSDHIQDSEAYLLTCLVFFPSFLGLVTPNPCTSVVTTVTLDRFGGGCAKDYRCCVNLCVYFSS